MPGPGSPGLASAGPLLLPSSVPLLCPYGHASGGDGAEEWTRQDVHGAKEMSQVTALVAAGIRWRSSVTGFGTKGSQVQILSPRLRRPRIYTGNRGFAAFVVYGE